MKNARYISMDGKVNNFIDANSITPKQYEEIYRSNLYCEEIDCTAQIVYNERQKGKFLRYFSTLQGSPHKKNCPNEVNRKIGKKPIVRIGGEDINISEKHIQKVLDDAYKSFFNKLYPSEEKTIEKKKRVKKTVSLQDNTLAASIDFSGTPVTTGKGKNVIEGKEPFIYKREVAEISSKDINTFKEIHGVIDKIRMDPNEIFIDLKGIDGSTISVYIGTPFRVNCEQEFNLMHYIEIYITKQKEINFPLICTSVGQLSHLSNSEIVQLFDFKHFKINRLSFYQIVDAVNQMAQIEFQI